MSVDLFLYSSQVAVPSRLQLHDALEKKGWFVFFLSQREEREPPAKSRLKNDLVFGTRDKALLGRARAVAKDEKKLVAFLGDEDLGGCALDAASPFSARKEFGDGLLDGLPAGVAARIVKAKSLYNVHTSAGRSDASMDLQTIVWETLGEMVGGLLNNPQSGEYILTGPKGRKVLVASEVKEGSPFDQFRKYFAALVKAGFPVENKNKDDFDSHPERMTAAELERLFAFTKKYFGPGNMEGLVLNQMNLETYKKRKGKAFVKANAGWLARIESKYTTPGPI